MTSQLEGWELLVAEINMADVLMNKEESNRESEDTMSIGDWR